MEFIARDNGVFISATDGQPSQEPLGSRIQSRQKASLPLVDVEQIDPPTPFFPELEASCA